DFDHEAGHLSEDDYRGLRDAYEARAATVLRALDALGVPARARAVTPRTGARVAPSRSWTRSPIALGTGALLLLAFGVLLGVSVGRYTEPDPMAPAPGTSVARAPAPGPMAPAGPAAPGAVTGPDAGAAAGPSRPLSPEMLAGMLEAARQSLFGGHADAALEAFDKALAIDPNYPPAYFFRGQVLAEAKGDRAGAARAWERFLVLVPSGPEHDQVKALLAEMRAKGAKAPG